MSRLAALVRHSTFDPRPDGALLGAFLADRDEAAFAELVRRHAPLVWGACRRGLPDLADVEDAFQATFLVLVRRANRLTGSATVGPWLYRVAAWTASNLRRKNARRLARRRELSDAPDPRPAPEPSFDLDAALLALPERYRAALVLCRLEGLTHREAADRLGCAEGTVSSLVSRGLAKLRARLTGRDPAAMLAVAAAVLVPNSLSAVAARSAAAFRVLSAAASPAVAELTEGVLRMFWVKKATAAGMAAFVLLTAGVGVGLLVRQAPRVAADDKPTARRADPPAEQLRKLEELLRDVDKKRARVDEERAALGQQMTLLREQLGRLKGELAADKTGGRRLVVSISGRLDKESLVITEYKDGNDTSSQYWTVTFSKVNWTHADLDVVRDYLTRAASDKSVAREVKIVAHKEALAKVVADVAKACGAAGFKSVAMVEPKPRDSGRVSPLDKPVSAAGIQVAVPEGGMVTSGPEGAAITIPVGGIARLTLSEGKFVELGGRRDIRPGDVEGDVISPSINALGVVTVRGLIESKGSVVELTDDRGGKHLIRVTVTEKGPGR